MMPIVNGLGEEFSNTVAVVLLNSAVPAEQRLAQSYGLRSHPSFAVLDSQGEVSQQFFGPQPEETLRAAMEGVAP